jgi:hypothetical protein
MTNDQASMTKQAPSLNALMSETVRPSRLKTLVIDALYLFGHWYLVIGH